MLYHRSCWMYDIRHIFLITGGGSNTHWLDGCFACGAKGFIKTGSDLYQDELTAAYWPLDLALHVLETSLTRVFAVGDVRAGSI
jgi:thioredoxin reductase